MKKIFVIVSLLIALIIIFGCEQAAEEREGEEISEGISGVWCQAGSTWEYAMPGEEANWEVKGIITSGNYEGLCHVIHTHMAAGKELKTNYYYNEGAETGYYEQEIQGQKMVYEIG